jgi:hypothetical protein
VELIRAGMLNLPHSRAKRKRRGGLPTDRRAASVSLATEARRQQDAGGTLIQIRIGMRHYNTSMITPKKTISAVAIAAALTFTFLARAENWPEFRGPTGQGISTARNLPTKWSTTENVAWKQAIPGAGWSSPILHNERIYLTTAVPPAGGGDQSLRALCLDAQGGKILWSAEVFSTAVIKGHAKNSQASPTPLTDGERLYCSFRPVRNGGARPERKSSLAQHESEISGVHGPGGSPILVATH